jgi:hypothetical protein
MAGGVTLRREKQRERDRQWYRDNKEIKDARVRAQRLANPEKESARHRLRHFVEKGWIVRPLFCETCGGAGPVDGHHTDYSKPLEVRWLCRSCHMLEHRKART